MASPKKRLPANVDGDVYVDSTCIDCDTCRWMAPEVFDEVDDQSRVFAQPKHAASRLRALQALISCPTGSIGTLQKPPLGEVFQSFPIPVHGEVYHCGYHHKDSFGAASYLIRRPAGNVLVDSPRFTPKLVQRLEALGGVSLLLLTHQDDVADHQGFARHFGCQRVLHRDDVHASTRGVERLLEGVCPVALDDELTAIPVPGHTQGSVCFLYRPGGDPAAPGTLFSGDHVAWSEAAGRVTAFRGACWYDWQEQVRSMERLNQHDFDWILPGHGRRCHFPADEMRARIDACLEWMRRV